MAAPQPSWYLVNGNAAVRQVVAGTPPKVEPFDVGERWGWGSTFWVTRDSISRGTAVFHFPISAPVLVSEPAPSRTVYWAHVSRVGIQGHFGEGSANGTRVHLVWIDVWERHNRIFTTSPEDASGQRTNKINLIGDYRDRWQEFTAPDNRLRSNVHRLGYGIENMPRAWGAIGVSVGFETSGGDHKVTFTNVGVEVQYFPSQQ